MYISNLRVKDSFAITPSDSTVLNPAADAIFVGVSGDLVVMTPKGTIVTYKNIAAGIYHGIEAVKVMAATTALQIVGGVCD